MFTQIQLKYAFNALEPALDALTVETHYTKHHATYTKNFNDAVEKAGLTGKTAEEILTSLDEITDPDLRTALQNNGGGYYNHNLYFSTLTPEKTTPSGALKAQIDQTFGSLDALKEQLLPLAVGQFGSGWAWLSANQEGELQISKSPNQDNPLTEKTGFTPILALDVWEHAYYLKYKNLRADYLENLWGLLDWAAISENYARVTGA